MRHAYDSDYIYTMFGKGGGEKRKNMRGKKNKGKVKGGEEKFVFPPLICLIKEGKKITSFPPSFSLV